MKKIWIDTSFALKNKTGVGAYIITLLNVLKLVGIEPQNRELKLPNKFKFRFIFHVLWLNTLYYFETNFRKPDFIIQPGFIMPFLTNRKTKYITVIHDLAHLRTKEMSAYNRFIFDFSTKIAIKKADILVTVSETVKQELLIQYDIPIDKIKVVYNSIGQHFINAQINNNIIEKYDLEPKKYILSVATLNKRKNIPELIKAFEQISNKYPNLKLVLVGGMGNEQREKLTKHPNVIFTGYIKDEELPTLYSNALLYMYPSLYEGFGIPLIEAQYCGCPVLCSDIPVFREIGANSVKYCNPTSNSIANELEVLINNPELLSKLSSLGSENVKRFSIENIAKQLNEVIK